MIIYQLLLDDPNYQQDKIDLTYSLLNEDIKASISRTTFTRGVKELRNVHFLAPTMHDGVYWINIDYVFKGNRLTLINQYILERKQRKSIDVPDTAAEPKATKNNLENQQPHL